MIKPVLSALTLASFSQYSDNPFPLKNAFLSSFFDMNCTGGALNPQENCNLDGKHLNLSAVLSSISLNSDLIRVIGFSALNKESNGHKYTSPQELLVSNKNSVLSFVNKSILTSPSFLAAIGDGTNVGYGNINRPYPAFLFSL